MPWLTAVQPRGNEKVGDIVAQDRAWAGNGAYAVLELLASEAPPSQFDVLVSQAREKGATDEELESLEDAKRLAVAISAELEQRRQREAGFTALVDTARELTAPHDLDALLNVITRRARLLLGVDMSYISFPDDEGGYVYVRTTSGHTSTLTVGLRLPDDAGLGSDVLTNPAPFWTPEYLADDRIRHSEVIDEVVRAEKLHAVMAVPLSHGTKPFGALYVASRSVRHFTADEISLMSSLGDLAGVAIERAMLLDRTAAAVTELESQSSRTRALVVGLKEIDDIHNTLIELVLSGGDLHAVAQEASRRLDGAVRICAANGAALATAGEMPEGEPDAVVLATMDAHVAHRPVPLENGLWAAPISAGNEDLGTLILRPDRVLRDREEQLLRLVSQAAAVQMLLQNRTAFAEGQVRDELLDDLLASPPRPPQQMEKHARRLGIDLNEPHVVVIARPEGESLGKAAIWASSYTHRMSGLKSMRNGCAVFLLPGTDAGAAARAVSDELSPLLGHQLTTSAAGPVTSPGSVFHGYQEALRCLDAMTSLGAIGRAASARELGFLGVLLSDNHDVEGYIDSAIGPVLDYDRLRSTELTRTLEVYFEAGGSPTYAAKKLHVHPNTVARRLERISELIGPEWQQPERALEVQLALRLSRVRSGLLRRGSGTAKERSADQDT
ncbi:helix-turn-helix domain-containing protein [Streptantibioticus ferralitis]|uniref:Helix-turn-helix domain-containing protein n=1 Tax=Streptantibioticus ferralitis TaxID=236510 RepID=A0ABT5ZA44_9ACTN|nr:helix-turn-helix domain-containing protein [Streptantibioticus ferralitis]MDF2260710.1 helix-turn-helix domain-containing protein [Streptantibioticus ferralitis]